MGMNKKKIVLICTPSIFLLSERVFCFLGILKVASAWEQQGESIDVIDLSGVKNYKSVIEDYFKNNKNIDFVGITATTPQMPAAFDIAEQIKRTNKDLKIVLGGPHGTAINAATRIEKKEKVVGRAHDAMEALEDMFDVIVCGDGELVLDLVRKTHKGIIDADKRESDLFLTNKQFTELPPPARHLIDLKSYKYKIEGHESTSLIGQLGCPFSCGFCGMRLSPSMRKIRNRSTDSIVSEIEFLHKHYGYTGFMLYDDELNVSPLIIELMNKISDLQDRLGVEFRLRGFMKSELTTEEQLKAMKRAGFRWLLCGFESASPRILKNINKKATLEDNTKFIEMAKKHGLKTKALTSIGHPGESRKTIEDTKKWLIDMEVEEFDTTVITVFASSPYYDFAKPYKDDIYVYTQPKTGDRLYQKQIDYTKQQGYYKGVPGSYTSFVWTDFISAEELVKERDDLESEVRKKLNIPFNPSDPSVKYNHETSMGQGFPDWIVRSNTDYSPPQREEKQKRKLGVIQ